MVDRLGVNTLAEIEANLETGESVKEALGENAEVIRDILRDYYREQGEPMLRRMAVKRHWTDAEINERRQTRIDNSMDGVSIFTLEDIVHHAWDMYQDGGATKGEIDRMATSDALRSAVDDHAVEEWIAGKLDGLLGEAGIYNGKDPYTPSGNLRSFSQLHYAYTLENIVKAMKEGQEERGGNTWGASAKTLQSVATPEYRSIQEIKADSGRLGMDEGAEYEAKLQAIDDQIGSIITKIKQGNKAHSDNSFVESDIIGSILMETSKGKRTVDAIMRAFSKEGYKISSQTAQDIQAVYQAAAEMPTGYFEAKPQRAVGFDEVLAAVIPDDSSKKLRDGLEQAGVRMLEYKTGDDADRLAKINSVEGARFSLKTVPPVKPTSDDWKPGQPSTRLRPPIRPCLPWTPTRRTPATRHRFPARSRATAKFTMPSRQRISTGPSWMQAPAWATGPEPGARSTALTWTTSSRSRTPSTSRTTPITPPWIRPTMSSSATRSLTSCHRTSATLWW